MIRHVVMWKFKEGTEEKQEEFLTRLQGLYGVIPEILSSQVGTDCKGGENYDCAIIADLADFDALGQWVNPKFCVNSNSGANRAKFICGGSRLVRLPPY